MRLFLACLLLNLGSAAFAQETKPFDLMDWTPRPAVGKGEPWERMNDPDWDDGRFRKADTGPAQNATFKYIQVRIQELVYKGTAVKVGNGAAIFDRALLRFATGWTDGYLQHSNRRFGLLNTPTVITPSVDQFFDVGIASITSFVTTWRLITFEVSTRGLAPDTVMVSSSVPTLRSTLMLAVNAVASSIFSRRTVENPVRVKVTV